MSKLLEKLLKANHRLIPSLSAYESLTLFLKYDGAVIPLSDSAIVYEASDILLA